MKTTHRTAVVVPELLQGEWTTALICTFGANLTFFETRLMSQLAQTPLRIVLADQEQLAKTLGEAARTGQRHRLANKAYVAAPLRHPRAAHAKLMLLLGPTSGRLVVGSGNLGYDGYASPGELWHVFAYRDDQPAHLDEFAAARSFLGTLAGRQLIDPPVLELLQAAWDRATWLPPAPTAPVAFHSNLDRPLVEYLRLAVKTPVSELIAHAPFHDADCAALEQLISNFAPRHVRLLVTGATSADPEAIARVLADAPEWTVEQVEIGAEPASYLHAKWVHLIHPGAETLLTGSANLSRSALLRTSELGNIEVGVISTGPPRSFDGLYKHLNRRQIKDLSTLTISYQGVGDEAPLDDYTPSHPMVAWALLEGSTLTIVFKQALAEDTTLELADDVGRALDIRSMAIEGETVRVSLAELSAERLRDGGRVTVQLDGDEATVSHTWPYHVAHLRGRLGRAHDREQLTRIGDLPDHDTELYELLRQLDQTLMIDRASVWRVAKPGVIPGAEDDETQSVGLDDLDWERVRRDPRYAGYFTRGRASGVAPTDIQIVLAAISGRLGELGLEPAISEADDEEDLASEGDAWLSAESDDVDDELEDELTRRRLPIATRTKMAFDRFVRRYSDALEDAGFIDELGVLPAVTNAAIFNHLLARLLEKGAVSTRWALEAQIHTWRFLWGGGDRPGIAERADDETADAVRSVLAEVGARTATLRSLVTSPNYADDETSVLMREVAQQLITADSLGLDTALIVETAGSSAMAGDILAALSQIATPSTPKEALDYVAVPYGIGRWSAGWRTERVRRAGRGSYRATTFVISSRIPGLTSDLAQQILERVAVAAFYAGHDADYCRVRFEGNGRSVAFWDKQTQSGVVLVGDDDQDINVFSPAWPDWSIRLAEIEGEIERAAVDQSA